MTPGEQGWREEPVRVTDKRRLDPDTGQVRAPGPGPDSADVVAAEVVEADVVAAEVVEADVVEAEVVGFHDAEPTAGEEAGLSEGAVEEPDPVQAELLERTADLQRLSAEYANYRRRVERDRQSVIEGAKAAVVLPLLGVLDDLDRARDHGDLEGPFKAVSEKLIDTLSGQGLTAFGAEGEAFDPSLHEAVSHEGSGGAPVLSMVMRKGYRFGARVLRPAMVGVTEEAAQPAATPAQGATE